METESSKNDCNEAGDEVRIINNIRELESLLQRDHPYLSFNDSNDEPCDGIRNIFSVSTLPPSYEGSHLFGTCIYYGAQCTII